MADQLTLADLDTYQPAACRKVCLRMRYRESTVELVCFEPPHHDGPHRYVAVERLRTTDEVPVRGAIL